MDRNRIKATARPAEGTMKAQAGKLTGHASLEAAGRIRTAEGTSRKANGKARTALRKG